MKQKIFYIVLLISTFVSAQVQMDVDTTHIRIGEQIQYQLSTDIQPKVVFPKLELDSLGKVEVVHSLPVDTLKNRLYKKYILTSFDSGVYKIPAQKVFINNQHYLTDSLLIHVGTVAIDTTKQGLFPIKPIYRAQPKTWRDYLYYLWWLLGLLTLIGIIWWFAFRVRKNRATKNKIVLSPIEEAEQLFQKLDAQDFIEQEKIKEYYVELTDIVRNYIGKDVQIPTLEVTTDELITLLEIHNKSKNLGIEKDRIKELHQFLKNADLVKFAKAKPDKPQIIEDRQTAENIVKDIQAIVHKPVLDEFGNEIVAVTEEEIKQKTTIKRRIIGVVIGLIILLLVGISSIAYYGFNYVKDTITGHPTKELLEGEWYQSSYGYPAVSLETPKVLKAQQGSGQIPIANFRYGSFLSNFYIQVTTIEGNAEQEVTVDMVIDNIVKMVQEQEGVTGFSYEDEDFNIEGITGKKLTGSFKMMNISMLFKQYVFVENNNIQVVLIAYKKDDSYAPKIADRIEKSIRLQKIGNSEDSNEQ